MALCAFCNSETELYVNDIPMCPKCDSEKRLIGDLKAQLERELSTQKSLAGDMSNCLVCRDARWA